MAEYLEIRPCCAPPAMGYRTVVLGSAVDENGHFCFVVVAVPVWVEQEINAVPFIQIHGNSVASRLCISVANNASGPFLIPVDAQDSNDAGVVLLWSLLQSLKCHLDLGFAGVIADPAQTSPRSIIAGHAQAFGIDVSVEVEPFRPHVVELWCISTE